MVFGLAYVADAPDSEDESLYISGLLAANIDPDAPGGLARLEAQTLAVQVIGQFPIPNTPYYEIADISGTGEARLFAFFATEPPVIAEVDESDASFVFADSLDGFSTGSAWAFAQWAGDLWLFTGTGPEGRSEVWRYELDTQALNLELDDLGARIVGAAVSTCAPFEPVG